MIDPLQHVQVDDMTSTPLIVQFGGPVLFNRYFIHLRDNGSSSYHQYGHDSNLQQCSKMCNLDATVSSMQDEMQNINQWSNEYNLQLNLKKTKLMLFSTNSMSKIHHLDKYTPDIVSGYQLIECVKRF